MPIRPPPLKLKYDNFIPPPLPSVRKQPIKESFFAKLYKANWRNFVIAVAGLNVLRYSYAAYNAHEDSLVDQSKHAPKLQMVSVALCAMYGVSVMIELFGVIGTSTRRFGFVRAYTFLAFVSATLATTASVLKTVSFFANAEELMYECVALTLTGQVYAKSQFRTRPWPSFAVGLRQAQKQCVEAWTQESWSQVLYIFVFGFMPSMICYLLVYTHYRQTIDISHPAYMITQSRGSSSRSQSNGGYARVNNDPPCAGTAQGETNSRVINTNQRSARRRVNAAAQNGRAATVAPVVAPTGAATLTTRGLSRAHRPPALQAVEPPIFTPQRGVLLQSAAVLSSWLSPGPPTYGINVPNQNRLPGGITLSCSGGSLVSAKYDKFV